MRSRGPGFQEGLFEETDHSVFVLFRTLANWPAQSFDAS